MISERDGLTGPERDIRIYRNATDEIIVSGYPVHLDLTTASDGVRVVKAVVGGLSAFVGVADTTASPGADFRVQVWGWRNGAMVLADTVSITNPGDILVPVAGQWYLTRDVTPTGDGRSGYVIAAETIPASFVSSVASRKVFIRGR